MSSEHKLAFFDSVYKGSHTQVATQFYFGILNHCLLVLFDLSGDYFIHHENLGSGSLWIPTRIKNHGNHASLCKQLSERRIAPMDFIQTMLPNIRQKVGGEISEKKSANKWVIF